MVQVDNFVTTKLLLLMEATLTHLWKKKHCSVAYHRVREAIAAGKQLIFYERSGTNLADLLTKPLSHIKRLPLIEAILS